MPRPLTPLQAHENRRFLDALARTGNARVGAREVGRPANSFHHRRKRHPGFAQDWAATVAAIHARLHLAGGRRGPDASVIASGAKPFRTGRARDSGAGLPPFDCLQGRRSGQARSAPRNDGCEALRTQGGEPIVVRTRGGKLQIRLAHPDKLTKACEQAFLYALSATANIRLAAAAAGASPAAFYRRRRQNPAFAREMRLALRMGWERLEAAALQAALPESHADDRWRQCAPAPLPRFTADQALQLLCLHDKSVHQSWEQPHRRRRRGESDETHGPACRRCGEPRRTSRRKPPPFAEPPASRTRATGATRTNRRRPSFRRWSW
jgi:hypothetical protein